MDFDLSKPQKLLKDAARDLLSRHCPPEKVRELMASETAHDDVLWQEIVDQGWTGITTPEEFGGLNLTTVELAVIAEEMGRACLPGAFMSGVFAGALIGEAGNEEQKKRYLEPLALGEINATVAFLEDDTAWNADSLSVCSKSDANGIILDGKKRFVADAGIADLIICAAQNGDGFMLLPVERDSPGLSITPSPSMDETRKIFDVDLASVHVESRNILGADGDAKGAFRRALNTATIAACAEMVGVMQWSLDATIEYVKTRQQFGKPIGVYQAVQHQCADMLLFTESSRSATYYAAWALSVNDPESALAVSTAKAYCSDAVREVCNRAVQLHGGIGFTWEHDLQLYYKRSKYSETLFGDAIYHREIIARSIVDQAI